VLTFDRAKREVRRADGTLLCRAESGYDPNVSRQGEPGEGVGHPELQAVPNVGPIPAGYWAMRGPPFQHPTAGPFVIRLEPVPGTNAFGRSGFLWHGGWAHPEQHQDNASHGCMLSPHDDRQRAWDEGDHLIHVV
jgi:hypothetical protein